MAIITHSKDENIRYAYLNLFPDQFKREKEKLRDSWIKQTMDYFGNKAYGEYVKNRESFVKNYDLLKGILRPEDFYEEQASSFMEDLEKDLDLPSYVKHFSILSTPVNELVGEISKRPDTFRVKAFDADSQNEELQFKTDLLQRYIIAQAKQRIIKKAQEEGNQLSDEELESLTMEEVKDSLASYTSTAEKWGNHLLTSMKIEFSLKEKSEECFRDLTVTSREFYLIYEDNSRLGFNIETLNPKNVWVLTTPDKKYISDPSERNQGAYAAGTVQVMEISEIIEAIPDITKEEIDHLRTSLQDYGLIGVRESNLGNPNAPTGIDSITYDTYDPLVLRTRMMIESEMKENNDQLQDFLGLTNNVSNFGYKYVVIRAYWVSKKLIGKLTYLDETGNLQSTIVDENYVSKTIPTQQSLEWGWINQWWQGVKIGPDIYHIKPLKILPYCPIVGTFYEWKNTESRSLVDLMKPFQVLYNVCMNQLYQLLEKEIGNVASINIRRVPRVKDGDSQDDIEIWEMEARENGIMFDDDSPENTKAPVTNTSVAKNIDLTRTNEIQSRYTLAAQLKNECWELVGLSRQRLGSISASESATGTNTAVSQSYSQTEPLFVAHEYVLGQLYQAMLDASIYIQSQKPLSTISYISTEGESAFIQVEGSELKLRDLKVFPTNRPEDTQMFNEIRSLAQPAMQNGASFYEIIELWTTKSMREMKKVFKGIKDRQEQIQNQQLQMQQQELQQKQQQAQATLEQAQNIHERDVENENYQRELDRINKKEVALIQAESKGSLPDVNTNNIPDVLEITRISQEREKLTREHEIRLQEILSKERQNSQKMSLEREKLQVDRENMSNDIEVAKINARNRAKSKTK